MYRPTLNRTDRSGAIAAVIAIHAALAFAFLNLGGRITLAPEQVGLNVFDVSAIQPPPPIVEIQPPEETREEEGEASPPNIESRATPVVRPEPRIELPVPPPITASPTPNQGAEPTQGASPVPGPGTGAGGSGTGTGAGGRGTGTGGGGDNIGVVPPQLVTPVLRGRDFPRELLDDWPRGAHVFVRFRVDARGYITQCIIDRGTGVPVIDDTICSLTQQKFRYRPATNKSGQPVAGWAGYRQTPPQ